MRTINQDLPEIKYDVAISAEDMLVDYSQSVPNIAIYPNTFFECSLKKYQRMWT